MLDELSLLETNQKNTVTLWPFLVQFIEESVDKSD